MAGAPGIPEWQSLPMYRFLWWLLLQVGLCRLLEQNSQFYVSILELLCLVGIYLLAAEGELQASGKGRQGECCRGLLSML